MGSIINNTIGLNAHRQIKRNSTEMLKVSTRLSTGKRINSAADDAAGLAISETMRAQIRGLDRAQQNVLEGIDVMNASDGGMSEITDMLQRQRELILQSLNGTNTDSEREKIQIELDQLTEEIDSMAYRTEYNTLSLLSTDDDHLITGDDLQSIDSMPLPVDLSALNSFLSSYISKEITMPDELHLQSGANSDEDVLINRYDCTVGTLGLTNLSAMNFDDSNNSLASIDNALFTMSDYRADCGALINKLEYVSNSLDQITENLTASESRIVDADMANEMMRYVQLNVLNQASMSMLAQSNQNQEAILQVLKF